MKNLVEPQLGNNLDNETPAAILLALGAIPMHLLMLVNILGADLNPNGSAEFTCNAPSYTMARRGLSSG